MRHRSYGCASVVRIGTAVLLTSSQLALPSAASAAPLGSSMASIGAVPPPGVTAVQSFQPDLFTGRAVTSIPIVVPPGRRGLQPNVALTYSSSTRNGWLGVGWSVDVGVIERSTKHGVPTYDSTDTFTLQFHGVSSDLVKIPDGSYRARDEGAFLRCRFDGSGWEVTDPAGTRYLFGQTPASRIQSGSNIFRWALDRVTDLHGNAMRFTYETDQGQLYLAQIWYTEPAVGPDPLNHVDFVIEDGRADIEVSYRSGSRIVTAKRLKGITVFALDRAIRTYLFGYDYSGRTKRSLLTAITQLGLDGSKLPATRLSYQAEPFPTYTRLPDLGLTVSSTWNTLAGDFNGDGLTDLASFERPTGTWKVSLSQRTGFAPAVQWVTGFGPDKTPIVGDWNQDGRADIGAYDAGTWQFLQSDGKSFQSMTPARFETSPGIPFTGDFNGDGATDIGTYNTSSWSFALHRGNTFVVIPSMTTAWGGSEYQPLTGDFNGDGLTDIAIVSLATGGVDIRLSDGSGWLGPQTWIKDFGPNTAHLAADLNGDGLSDVAYYNWPSGQTIYAPSTGLPPPAGNGFAAPRVADHPALTLRTLTTQLEPADFNGDGLVDPSVFDPTSGKGEVAVSTGPVVDLLTRLTNGVGGTTTLAYQPAAWFDNTSPATGLPQLPFSVPVVTQSALDDGLGHQYVTRYTYRQGVYDSVSQEFNGFAHVESTDPAGTVTAVDFLQDSALKGHAALTVVRDSAGNLFTKQSATWSAKDLFPGVHFARLLQQEQLVYDGDATFQQTRQRFAYDDYGNVTQVFDDGDVAVIGDERSTRTTYLVNTAAWIVGLPRVTETLDPAGVVLAKRVLCYDGATDSKPIMPTKGLVTRTDAWLKESNTYLSASVTHDSYGNVATVTNPRNFTTKTTYDSTATYPMTMTNAVGHVAQVTTDPKFGVVTQTIDANGQVTKHQYDVFGRLAAVIGPLDSAAYPTTRMIYQLGSPISKTTSCTRIQSGATKELCVDTYTDGLGRVIQTRSPAENPTQQVVSGPLERDSRGLVVKQWRPYLDAVSSSYVAVFSIANLPAPITYTYDAVGRVKAASRPDGAVVSTSYSDWSVTTTDANGHRIRRTQDSSGRLAKVEEVNGTQIYTTLYTYDLLNRLIWVKDHNGNVTSLTYDSLGRKLTATDPDLGLWSYTYDPAGNLATQTDARGVRTDFTYDALNRLIQKRYTVPVGSSTVATPAVTYTYDDPQVAYSKGRLTKISNTMSTSTSTYDRLGRVITESKAIGGTTYTIRRAYDLLGRMTALTYPDGEQALYAYNDQGGLETLNLQSTAGTVQRIVIDNTYNAAGQITNATLGNGVTTSYTYDPVTQQLSRLVTRTAAVKLQDLSYRFDRVGNVARIDDTLVPANGQLFGYDSLDRLVTANGPYGAQWYGYDPVGNLVTKEGMTLTYGTIIRPHAVIATSGGIDFAYDSNGNLIKKTVHATGALVAALAYDAENRLVSYAAGTSTRFGYDGDGGRVSVTTPAGTTRYVGSFYEIPPPGGAKKYLIVGNQRVAMKEPSGLRFFHADHLGSTSLVTDAAGQVVERVMYKPYGAIFSRTGTTNVAHKFTGQQLDPTGLCFYGARYYDPTLGRFISPDSIVPGPGDPQSLNRYSYVRNNPTNRVDPTGHWSFRKWLKSLFSPREVAERAVGTFVPLGTGSDAQQATNEVATKIGVNPTSVSAGMAALPHVAVGDFVGAAIIAAAGIGAHELRMTGEGRQLTRRVGHQFFDDVLGMSPRTAYIAAAVTIEAGASIALESALAVALYGPPLPSRPTVEADLPAQPSGIWPYGTYPQLGYTPIGNAHYTMQTLSNGAIIGQGPIQTGIFKYLPQAIHVGASAPAGIAGAGLQQFPGGWWIYGTYDVCHSAANTTVLMSGASNTVLTNDLHWSTALSTAIGGNYGGGVYRSIGAGLSAANEQ